MRNLLGKTLGLVGIVGWALACGGGAEEGGGTTGEASTNPTTDATTGVSASTSGSAVGTSEASSSGASSESSDGSSGRADETSSSTTDGLPDYRDSKCWGAASNTLVYNGETHQTGSVAATCRAEGERTLLYVQDELWENAVDQAAVNAFMHRFEIFTPEGSFDPEQGVITNNEAIFGELDLASFPDGKLAIFVVDSGGGGDGYLCSWCAYPQLHLDGQILQPLDGDFPVSIAAHESYHVIHRAIDNNEATWVDESLAEAAMTANGFFTDTDWLADFLGDPDQNWGPGNPELGGFNYGAALLWGTYLWEYGGPDLMYAITHEAADDWAGLDAALDSLGDDQSAYGLYLNMLVSVYLDAPELGYGFGSFAVEDVARAGDLNLGAMQGGGLAPYGVDYYRITAAGDVVLTAASEDPDVVALGVSAGATVTIVEISTSTPLSIGDGDIAFVLVTGRAAATYDLMLQ